MRIDSGNIELESNRSFTVEKSQSRSYKVETLSYEEDYNGAFSMLLNVNPSANSDKVQGFDDAIQKLRENMINLLLRLLFPDRKFDLNNEASSFSFSNRQTDQENMLHVNMKQEKYYFEKEDTSMQAKCNVICEDGSVIDLNLNLCMSRSFCEYYSEEVDFLQAALTDPLVINFDAPSALLSEETIRFDIDADGVEDEISRLIEGSGFLALDLNNDGIINDGSELFGAKSGDGFSDLSIYDTDKDGFIDEDDEVFDKLRIMTFEKDGSQHLYSLREKGVGAIGLSKISTQFALNSSNNNTLGLIKNTGVFLFENKNAGSIQQLDLAKREKLAAYA